MVGFAGGGIGGHDNCRVRVKRSRGEIGIGHERNVGGEAIACCQMELGGVSVSVCREDLVDSSDTYKTGVLQT